MRIRSTKPEFWKSRRITSVSWDARLVLKGLESYVDDNGVGVDDIELIVTDVFPRDLFANPRDTIARVSEAISELHRAGLVHRYDGGSDRLLYVAFWESIQRIDKPGKGRNPRPDGTLEYKDSEIRESVANVPEILAPGTGEQGNRGTEEQGIREQKNSPSPAVLASEFDRAWSSWPKKVEKQPAFEKFKTKCRTRVPSELADDIVRFGEAYAATTDKQFVPGLAVWLNKERWTDELPQARGQQQRKLTNAEAGFLEYQEMYGGGGHEHAGGPRALDQGVSS